MKQTFHTFLTRVALTLLPVMMFSFATARAQRIETTCGNGISMGLADRDHDGIVETIYIQGSGEMWDFDSKDAPWWGKYSGSIDNETLANYLEWASNGLKTEVHITNIEIQDGVTCIGKRAFSHIHEGTPTSISIPNSVVSIGDQAFYRSYISNLTIPNSVKTIGKNAFYGCDCDITIGTGIESIGDRAFFDFDDYNRTYSITILAPSVPTLGAYVFSKWDHSNWDENYEEIGPPSGCKIYVPNSLVETYKTAERWSEYADYIEPYAWITTQPTDLELPSGYSSSYVLTVAAKAPDGFTFSYQWYRNTTNSNTGGTLISGATNSRYPIPKGKALGTTEYYYCVVTATSTDINQSENITSNVATVSVTTMAPILITLDEPYTQDFEKPEVTTWSNDRGDVPLGWTSSHPYDTKVITARESDLNNYSQSGQVLYFYGEADCYAALPKFTNPLSDLQISFKWGVGSPCSWAGTLILGYITDEDNNFNTFTEIQSYRVTRSEEERTMKQADPVSLHQLPANAERLAFRYSCSSWIPCNVDDVVVSLTPTIDLADASSNSAVVSGNNRKMFHVRLADRTLYKDNDWNTLCVPFAVDDFTGTPLEGARVMELDAETSNLSDGTLTLNFTETTSIVAGRPYIVKWDVPEVVTIRSASDWDTFAENVANGNDYEDMLVRLANDITVTMSVGIDGKNSFSGTFDGCGHTLNVNIIDESNSFTAPFRWINGATIQNVKVTGTVRGTMYCAGLVGNAYQSTNVIESCEVAVVVTCGGSTHTHCGGIVGYNTESVLTITDCLFSGSISGATTATGIIVGWLDEDVATLRNCLEKGTYTNCGGVDLLKKYRGDMDIINCYNYTNSVKLGIPISYAYGEILSRLGDGWMANGSDVVPKMNVSSVMTIKNPVFNHVTIDATASTSVNFDGGQFVGSYSPFAITDENIDEIVYLGSNNTIGYATAPRTLRACRVHFYLPKTSSARTMNRAILNFGDDATGIVTIDDRKATGKRDSGNGSKMGDVDDAWYSLVGRKFSGKPSAKGIYIHNGRKVVRSEK